LFYLFLLNYLKFKNYLRMKVINYLLTFTLILAFSSGIMAQRNCGAMDYLEQQIQEDPKREAKMEAIERFTGDYIENSDRAVNGIVTIPVVVHVIYNNSTENISDAQVFSQITVLNDDFRRTNSDADGTWPQAEDSEIEFCMATVDPNGNPTNGITRTSTSVSAFGTNDQMKFNSSGGKDAWPAGDYLNVWVCDISGGILGYAQFPGGSASTDGVVIDYQYFGTTGTATAPFDLGRTATHEVGHWLNLRHIWGDGNCNVDDFVADTPTSDAPNYGCAVGHVSCNSTDMVQNYMDYSDDACMNLFTAGQNARMRALFDTGGFRQSLLSSNGCGQGNPPTCSDGIQNGDETGVDCGGTTCPPCSSGCDDNAVTITINLDNYPEETSWTVTNSSGVIVASGGTYGSQPDGSTVTEELCLVDGCYDFNIFDSYGDGICCSYGSGSYSVTDANGNVLASGGSFGSSESTNFCFGGGPAPTCDDGVQNGDETGVDCGGSCAPCVTCDDGIQNGDETGIDCGGSCPDACATCDDGIQNGDETGIDCGGSCAPCGGGGCSYVTIDDNNFDSGWGIWNDGGSDCRRSSRDEAYANTGLYCIRLRDNTSTSTMTTDNLNLAAYDELTVDFNFWPRSMENGEDFWLQVSTNGGSSYTTVASWVSGVDFSNNSRYFENVVISGITFTSNTRLRFRCDASGNSDYIYIDDVLITGCLNSNRDSGQSIFAETVEMPSDDNARIVETTSEISDVKLFPNPTSGLMNVSFDIDKNSDVQLIVTNITGQVVLSQDLQINAGTYGTEIDASRFGQGIFFLNLATKDGVITKKFVVVR
jgi:hypothetical protein